MSFRDLPRDWPSRSLGDPDLASDVLDLCVSDADRMTGGISFLLCRADGSLAQPVFVGQIPHETAMRETVSTTVLSCVTLAGVAGVVIGLARPWGAVNDQDRRLHQHAIKVCGRALVDLHGTFVVTGAGLTHLPVARELRAGRDVA